MDAELQQFASDNYAGICPEAWDADPARVDALARDIRAFSAELG